MILGSSTLYVKAEPGFRDLYRKQDLYRALCAAPVVVDLCEVVESSRGSLARCLGRQQCLLPRSSLARCPEGSRHSSPGAAAGETTMRALVCKA